MTPTEISSPQLRSAMAAEREKFSQDILSLVRRYEATVGTTVTRIEIINHTEKTMTGPIGTTKVKIS